jgi:hypothetical protein
MARHSRPVVVGTLPSGAWVGLGPALGAFRLVVGADGREEIDERDDALARRALLALAIAYFEEALEDGPPDAAEATHQDMADLVSWLAATAADQDERTAARQALDAVEDGLAGDAVTLLLIALFERSSERTPAPQASAEPVEFLAERASALLLR